MAVLQFAQPVAPSPASVCAHCCPLQTRLSSVALCLCASSLSSGLSMCHSQDIRICHICIHIHSHTHTYLCVCARARVRACMHAHTHVRVHGRTCGHAHVTTPDTCKTGEQSDVGRGGGKHRQEGRSCSSCSSCNTAPRHHAHSHAASRGLRRLRAHAAERHACGVSRQETSRGACV